MERLLKGLEMEGSRNRFALFEHGPDGELAIESRTLLVDVLARFERYEASAHHFASILPCTDSYIVF